MHDSPFSERRDALGSTSLDGCAQCENARMRRAIGHAGLAVGVVGHRPVMPGSPVLVLSLTQMVSYGAVYYALPVLTISIRAAEGWSVPSILTAFTGGLAVSAVTGLWTGRHLDRCGPRTLMTGGSALAAVGLAGLALSPTFATFTLCWVLLGPAMAATFNAVAFAAATGWAGDDAAARLRALTWITVIGGLASTVFAPLAAMLEAHLGWRGTYLVLAAVIATTNVPLHWWGLGRPWPAATALRHQGGRGSVGRAGVRVADPILLRLTGALALGSLSLLAVVVALPSMLEDMGLATSTAAAALGLGGVGQVLGRLGYSRIHATVGLRARTRVILCAGGATTLVLGVVEPVAAVMVLALLAGAARGLFTLVQATAVSDRWGRCGYGARNGVVAAGSTAAVACAPAAAGGLLTVTDSYALTFLVLGAATIAAAALAPGKGAPEGAYEGRVAAGRCDDRGSPHPVEGRIPTGAKFHDVPDVRRRG